VISPNQVMLGSYDYRLVALSVVIAGLAAYAALDLAGRVTSARGAARRHWLAGGATAMGIGIWSMHYVGMLAFQLARSGAEYDWPTVLALAAGGHLSPRPWRCTFASQDRMRDGPAGSHHRQHCSWAAASPGMHYVGMAAMRAAGDVRE
jgi:NO-binding membrane sensor protein with MHYT domain